MLTISSLATGLLALASTTFALPSTLQARGDTACVNGPSTRDCWKNGFSVNTNSYEKFPDTGKTVTVCMPGS